MKKTILMLSILTLLCALTPLTALARSAHSTASRPLCHVDSCTAERAHTHRGTRYAGHCTGENGSQYCSRSSCPYTRATSSGTNGNGCRRAPCR